MLKRLQELACCLLVVVAIDVVYVKRHDEYHRHHRGGDDAAAVTTTAPSRMKVDALSTLSTTNDTLWFGDEAPCFPRCGTDQPQSFATASTIPGGVKLLMRQQDCRLFNGATEARIYPENLNWAVITKRGGWGGGSECRGVNACNGSENTKKPNCTKNNDAGGGGGGGVTIMDISQPAHPVPVLVWSAPNHDAVEGQDRLGSMLVVSSVAQGGIYVFNITESSSAESSSASTTATVQDKQWQRQRQLQQKRTTTTIDRRDSLKKQKQKKKQKNDVVMELISYTDIPDAGMTLHVKLKRYDVTGQIVAFLSQGWCRDDAQLHCAQHDGVTGKVHIVDVTDPHNPTVLSAAKTATYQPEGLMIRGNYLYVGGIKSTTFSIVNITDPYHAEFVDSLQRPEYNQMVGQMLHEGVDGSFNAAHGNQLRYFVSALWGTPGGIAIFDTIDPRRPQQIASLADITMSTANRIHIHHHQYAVVPIEIDPAGGFALVDVADPFHPHLLGIHFLGVGTLPDGEMTAASTRVYALVVKDDAVILLVAKTCELYSFQVSRLQLDPSTRIARRQ